MIFLRSPLNMLLQPRRTGCARAVNTIKMKNPIRKISILFFVLLLVFYAFRGGHRRPAYEGERVVVKRGDLVVLASETGFLVPVNAIEIKSEQAGEVSKIFVQEGDHVKVGQKLAILKPESNQAQRVAEARAEVEQERLNLEEAERGHKRDTELFAKGYIARKEMEEARKFSQNGKIRYELAKRKLLLTLGGNKALYEKQLKNLFTETMAEFFVLSPVSGTVIAMNVSEGTMVSSGVSTVKDGTTLMRVSDLSKMWIKTKINEVNIGEIEEGQKAKITLDAIANKVYNGRVVKISPKGETVDNVVSYEVTIELANPDQRLMPSMTANIDIVTHVEKNVIYLPRIALTKWKGQDAVRVSLSHDEEKRFKPVTLGVKNESMVVITEGLVEGEAVLVPKKEEEKDGRS